MKSTGQSLPSHQSNPSSPSTISRRRFVHTIGLCAGAGVIGHAVSAGAGGAGLQPPPRTVKLGFDHFSVRAFGWKAPQLIDYAGTLKVDSLLLSESNVFESDTASYLAELKSRAAGLGMVLYSGMGSICPTSGTFDKKSGTAVEQIEKAIRVAKGVGSPVIRCFLGRGDDRLMDGGIEAHIEQTVKVCKEVRSRVIDAGLKLAVENHAGDMQSWELVTLIEAAGKDFVGANIDPGNAVWTMEDPVSNLETLAPYVICTSVRDSAMWETADGVSVQWTAMGDGQIDFRRYTALLGELCPGVPLHIETISGLTRNFPVSTEAFWKPWPKARARGYANWLAIARQGKPRPPFTPAPAGQDKRAAEQAQQKSELERSLTYCRTTLGLGIRPQ
jgi:sugar phosphate isomerase/epimerase